MPIQNGKYVNPGWVDNSPPAIDAAELNAISETLEKLDDGGGGTSYTEGDGISIQGTEISVALSSQADNAATFGSDGGIYVAQSGGGGGGGKRYAVFVVGTSTAGWTAAECDYLCDGTDDHVEINQAIYDLPDAGGEIVLLPGTYNISQYIRANASGGYGDVLLHGAGSHAQSVTLKWAGSYTQEEDPDQGTPGYGNCMMVIWRGCAENISFDMSDGSQASGNVGVNLGTLGIVKECYFSNCPTSVVCGGIGAKVLNCFFLNIGKYGCYLSDGYMSGCYLNVPRTTSSYGVYSNQLGPTGSVLLVGNIFEAPYNSNSIGVCLIGYGTPCLIANNILTECTISDQTTNGEPVIANNIQK